MSTYATRAEVEAYLSRSAYPEDPDPPLPPGAEGDELIRDGERDVDDEIGGGPADLTTGLKLNPALLTAAQRAALARAVGAAVEHRLLVDVEDRAAAGAYGPTDEVTELRPPAWIAPKILKELAGFGLLEDRWCASPTPEPDPPIAA